MSHPRQSRTSKSLMLLGYVCNLRNTQLEYALTMRFSLTVDGKLPLHGIRSHSSPAKFFSIVVKVL